MNWRPGCFSASLAASSFALTSDQWMRVGGYSGSMAQVRPSMQDASFALWSRVMMYMIYGGLLLIDKLAKLPIVLPSEVQAPSVRKHG